MNYAPQFIALFEKLESLMTKKGEHFRGRAYSKLKTLSYCMENLFTNLMKLKVTQYWFYYTKKIQRIMETGTLQVLERAKNDPMLIFTEVYGIGSKKAKN